MNAVAVASLALGVLRVVLSIMVIWYLSGAISDGPRNDSNLLDVAGFAMLVFFWPALLTIAILSFLAGGFLLIAGVAVFRRRRFGRTLTLVLGALAGVLALLYAFQGLSELAGASPAPEWVGASALGVLVHGGYSALVFWVLLDRKAAGEFRQEI